MLLYRRRRALCADGDVPREYFRHVTAFSCLLKRCCGRHCCSRQRWLGILIVIVGWLDYCLDQSTLRLFWLFVGLLLQRVIRTDPLVLRLYVVIPLRVTTAVLLRCYWRHLAWRCCCIVVMLLVMTCGANVLALQHACRCGMPLFRWLQTCTAFAGSYLVVTCSCNCVAWPACAIVVRFVPHICWLLFGVVGFQPALLSTLCVVVTCCCCCYHSCWSLDSFVTRCSCVVGLLFTCCSTVGELFAITGYCICSFFVVVVVVVVGYVVVLIAGRCGLLLLLLFSCCCRCCYCYCCSTLMICWSTLLPLWCVAVIHTLLRCRCCYVVPVVVRCCCCCCSVAILSPRCYIHSLLLLVRCCCCCSCCCCWSVVVALLWCRYLLHLCCSVPSGDCSVFLLHSHLVLLIVVVILVAVRPVVVVVQLPSCCYLCAFVVCSYVFCSVVVRCCCLQAISLLFSLLLRCLLFIPCLRCYPCSFVVVVRWLRILMLLLCWLLLFVRCGHSISLLLLFRCCYSFVVRCWSVYS